jgi:hypothetical protein
MWMSTQVNVAKLLMRTNATVVNDRLQNLVPDLVEAEFVAPAQNGIGQVLPQTAGNMPG